MKELGENEIEHALLSLLKGNKEKVANIVNPVLLKREST